MVLSGGRPLHRGVHGLSPPTFAAAQARCQLAHDAHALRGNRAPAPHGERLVGRVAPVARARHGGRETRDRPLTHARGGGRWGSLLDASSYGSEGRWLDKRERNLIQSP